MKIIDDNDDYFLHDFDSEETQTGLTPDGSASGSTTAPTDTATGHGNTPHDREFEFTPPVTPPPSRPRRRGRRVLMSILAVILVVLGVTFYIRYFVPHTTECKIRGYITNVEKRGIFFKTFEGEMISESQLVDTSRVYQRDVVFSIPSDSLGRLLQARQGTGHPVVITVKRYYGNLPWRGATNTIVTDVIDAR